MSAMIQTGRAVALSAWEPRQLALIRRTVAKDCNDDEFEIFIGYCRALNLDPLRRQIYAFVFHKDKADKRQLTIVTAIGGLRTIAERTGNYRPDTDGPVLVYDETAKGPNNPFGLVSAAVRVFKFSHGEWFPVTETAYWEEFAPLKEVWEYDQEQGRKAPTGRFQLDTSGQWGKMGRLMLAKCAEALALRKAWPDDFSNVYVEEELDKTRFLELSATEAADEGRKQERLEKIGLGAGPHLMLTFDDLGTLEPVPVGKVYDRAMAYVTEHKDEASVITLWQQRNQASLREFWAHDKPAALDLRKKIEEAVKAAAEASTDEGDAESTEDAGRDQQVTEEAAE
ncbi:phage recombination protein Bet [uncultured Alsobacter sp.]|uniref:phage recombination protein Bet n=1 Tax=uncultured Alsobacter sp. TaxID=1748258 RepID=UPI0025CCB41B|nr:phage recombination protein Bet [uncultured Alsobacter sp.]